MDLHLETPRVGLSMMVEADFLDATRELFDGDEVDALEWTLDVGWCADVSDDVRTTLAAFAERGALYGHGFAFSALSGVDAASHHSWLRLLSREISTRRYRHVSEHHGFMFAGDFVHSAPLPVPRTQRSVALGCDRLRRLRDAAETPVGLENLAIAFGMSDVLDQGPFLAELLEPVDGFVVLDLHNLYCHIHNFDVDPVAILRRYPLERVRELHVSGGSFSTPAADPRGRWFRRDTHDGSVPEEVFALVPLALSMCPHVEAIFLERLGNTLADERDKARLRHDYRRLRNLAHHRSEEST